MPRDLRDVLSYGSLIFQIFKDLDACVSPVLTVDEAVKLDHNVMQNAFDQSKDINAPVPTPEPQLSLNVSQSRAAQRRPPAVGEHSLEVLKTLGYNKEEIFGLAKRKAIFLAYENAKL